MSAMTVEINKKKRPANFSLTGNGKELKQLLVNRSTILKEYQDACSTLKPELAQNSGLGPMTSYRVVAIAGPSLVTSTVVTAAGSTMASSHGDQHPK
jgi:hypothetical protein